MNLKYHIHKKKGMENVRNTQIQKRWVRLLHLTLNGYKTENNLQTHQQYNKSC